MSSAYLFYRHLTTFLFWVLLPVFKIYSILDRRYTEGFNQRIGVYPPRFKKKRPEKPKIWMHAASVGEVSVAGVIAEEIFRLVPGANIIVSTTTQSGQAFARAKLPRYVDLIYAPLDSVFAVRKGLSHLKPDVLVCVETEIWPNWFVEASRLGIKTVLVNGRISMRSIDRYLRIASLMAPVLGSVEIFSMIHPDDENRILRMGASPDRVVVNGNAKYDGLIRSKETFCLEDVLRTYSLTGEDFLFVAGSTRQNEESAVCDAYETILREFPDTLLFIVPRHIERAPSICKLVSSRGHRCQLRSEFDGIDRKRTSPVVIVDTIGELAAIYGAATIAFCGGSLVPLGGQNLLEAAVWGKPVFYGPSMEDFQEARMMVESIAGDTFLVQSSKELSQKAIYYLKKTTERKKVGDALRAEVLKHQGAARRHAETVVNALKRT